MTCNVLNTIYLLSQCDSCEVIEIIPSTSYDTHNYHHQQQQQLIKIGTIPPKVTYARTIIEGENLIEFTEQSTSH